MQPDPEHPTLSPQQARVFAYLARGFLYIEIANIMGLKVDVVKQYAVKAKDKLKASTMFEAAVMAERQGLIAEIPEGAE